MTTTKTHRRSKGTQVIIVNKDGDYLIINELGLCAALKHSEYEALRICNKHDLKCEPHTSLAGQKILKRYQAKQSAENHIK